MTDSLPSFRYPPLAEVVIGLTFSTPKPVISPLLAKYWLSLSDRFPKVEQHDPINPQIERFASRVRATIPEFRIQFRTGNFTPRLWLLDESAHELIQVQSDMFLRNWRRYNSPDLSYPRFKELRPAFLDDFQGFRKFVETEGLGPLEILQVEVTYVNHISAPDEKDIELASIFRHWSSTRTGIGDLENVDVVFSKLIYLPGDVQPVGRLHVQMRTSWQSEKPVLVLSLTARGNAPKFEDFLELAHREIVLGFDSVTTDVMHKIWEKNVE